MILRISEYEVVQALVFWLEQKKGVQIEPESLRIVVGEDQESFDGYETELADSFSFLPMTSVSSRGD